MQRLLYDAATNPGSLGASVMMTSHTPNITLEEQKKKEEEARDAALEALKRHIDELNERISKMIDECNKMAEWCLKQAEKAAEAMDKIATRMAKNSEFISDVDELFENYKATGHFDKEKARKMLLERGVKTDENVSDGKLLELLRAQKNEAFGDIARDTKTYEELEKRKQKFEESAEEIERLARELKQHRDEINNDKKLSLTEQAEQLKELEGQYSPKVQAIAAGLEDGVKAQELREKSQIAYEKPANEKKGDMSSFMSDFAVSAKPAEKEIKSDKSGIEDSLTNSSEILRPGAGLKNPSSA